MIVVFISSCVVFSIHSGKSTIFINIQILVVFNDRHQSHPISVKPYKFARHVQRLSTTPKMDPLERV